MPPGSALVPGGAWALLLAGLLAALVGLGSALPPAEGSALWRALRLPAQPTERYGIVHRPGGLPHTPPTPPRWLPDGGRPIASQYTLLRTNRHFSLGNNAMMPVRFILCAVLLAGVGTAVALLRGWRRRRAPTPTPWAEAPRGVVVCAAYAGDRARREPARDTARPSSRIDRSRPPEPEGRRLRGQAPPFEMPRPSTRGPSTTPYSRRLREEEQGEDQEDTPQAGSGLRRRLQEDLARIGTLQGPEQPRSYFAACPKGLEAVLAGEVAALGARRVAEAPGGCTFEGPAQLGYEAVLWLRTANRVMELIVTDDAVQGREDLYDFVYELDWLRYFPIDPKAPQSIVRATMAVDVGLGLVGEDLQHSHFTALTVKNAIADQLARRCGGHRPDVATEAPVVPLYLHLHQGRAFLYRSLSGHHDSLHHRGYRGAIIHKAVLRENVAAALLMLAGWPQKVDTAMAEPGGPPAVLGDPMCGSGTLLVEAALLATRTAPGLLRLDRRALEGGSAPCFESWPDFDVAGWQRALTAARLARRSPEEIAASGRVRIFGSDSSESSTRLARECSHLSGMGPLIQLHTLDAAEWQVPVPPTLVVTNPPWELRLKGDAEYLAEAWGALRTFLRNNAGPPGPAGLDAWVLSGNKDATRHLRMRKARSVAVEAGGVGLRLLHYVALPPKPDLAP
eukprot:EG_transcript_5566